MENNDIEMCSNCAHYSDPGPRSMDMGWCIVHEQSNFCTDHCICYNRKYPINNNFAEMFASQLVNIQPQSDTAWNDVITIIDNFKLTKLEALNYIISNDFSYDEWTEAGMFHALREVLMDDREEFEK